ncbi:hypothetical protein KFL_009430030 [Klebsormidium nitens]|uniref:Uncharacterized protein n=1 Tax=Klebsormidium nitens TaxID=105231 RepID=A0A1Y1IVB6_KLENI|nr:hypothetical protein KFL_009430030 [Klebsormidium nitens]|eukprot:GAQ92198.1 hypothetical protein KFL_009430030 [Klebsormidium nitens]
MHTQFDIDRETAIRVSLTQGRRHSHGFLRHIHPHWQPLQAEAGELARMEAVPLSQLGDVLTHELGGPAGGGQAWVSVERGRCSLRICAQPFEWWLKAIIEAAKAWGEKVIDESNPDLQTADWLAQMTAKHVELNPIVAAFIGILNDTIGHSFPRSKAKTDPSTVPAYFPGPADAYAGRTQSMTLDQLVHVLQSIFDFIQATHWGRQDIKDLRDALVAAAWHPLASSVGTWAGLNCCFEALAKRARDAGYGDRGKAGLKKAGPNRDWRAVGPDGPHELWKKKKKSEQGSKDEVLPAGEVLREEEARDEEGREGGSGTKRARGVPRAKATPSGGAGRKNGRTPGGRKRAMVHLARQSSGRAARGGLPSLVAVPAYGGAGTHSTVAIGDDPGGLQPADLKELDDLDEFLGSVSSDLEKGAFDGLPMDGERTRLDLDGDENGGQGWGSQPARGSPNRPGAGSEASNLLHGDSANGAPASSGEFPSRGSGGLQFPEPDNLSPGRFGGIDALPVYLPGDLVRTTPVPDPRSMEMYGELSGPAAVGVGRDGARLLPNQWEEFWRAESPGNGGFPAPGLEGRPLYHSVYSGPAVPAADVFLGRARDEAAQQNFSPTHLVAAGSQTLFTDNLVSPGATSYVGQYHGVAPYAPGQTPPSPGGLYSRDPPHAVPFPGAPNSVRSQVHPSQATHLWHPNQGVPPRGDLYPPSAMPPAGGSPQWYHQHQPTPPGHQFLHSAGPGNDWNSVHPSQTGWAEPPVHSPGSGYASPAATVHSHWGASHSSTWQQPEGSGAQPMVVHRGKVPPRAAAPVAASTPSKLTSLINTLLRSNPKPVIPNPGVVSDRHFATGGANFHAAQHPPIHTGHSGSALVRLEQQVDPRGVHSAQFRRRNSFGRDPSARSPGVGGTYWAPQPPHLHPVPAKTALLRPERQIEPSDVHSAQFRRQVSVVRSLSARFRRNASMKRASNPPRGRELEGEEELEAELAALVKILKLEDYATEHPCPRARGIPLGRGRHAAGADGDNDEASDGAEGNERSDDSDTDESEWESDASGDESDGPCGTGPTAGSAVVTSEDKSSRSPDGTHAGAYGSAHVPGERPPVTHRQAPQAAPGTGAWKIGTGATTAPNWDSPPSTSAPELLRSCQAEPKPGVRLSSPGDRNRDHPAASLYKVQTSDVGEVPEARKSLSAAAAADFPADGTMNGTTASADLSGTHHGRWAPAPGGAPKRVYAERGQKRAYGHKRTDSPSSVLPPVAAELFQPGKEIVMQATG